MNPLFHTGFSISDSLKSVRKSVLIYETIILAISGVYLFDIHLLTIIQILNTTAFLDYVNHLNIQGFHSYYLGRIFKPAVEKDIIS